MTIGTPNTNTDIKSKIRSLKAHSVNELATAVGQAMNITPTINYLKQREEVIHAYSSHEKFKKTFNPKPAISLTEGLAKMAAWAKKHGPQTNTKFSNIEITKNLPPSWQ